MLVPGDRNEEHLTENRNRRLGCWTVSHLQKDKPIPKGKEFAKIINSNRQSKISVLLALLNCAPHQIEKQLQDDQCNLPELPFQITRTILFALRTAIQHTKDQPSLSVARRTARFAAPGQGCTLHHQGAVFETRQHHPGIFKREKSQPFQTNLTGAGSGWFVQSALPLF